MMKDKNKHAPDFVILFVTFALVSIGIIMVFSSSAYVAIISHSDQFHFLRLQLLFVLIGLGVLIFAMYFNYNNILLHIGAPISLILVLGWLTATFLTGQEVSGATRWIDVGVRPFQPSEFAKVFMVIFIAWYLHIRHRHLQDFWKGLMPPVVTLVIVCVLIAAQPDIGTAAVIAGTVLLLCAIAGAKILHLAVVATAGALASGLYIISRSYMMMRIDAFLNPHENPLGAGYQSIQSLLAFGSGGFSGSGLGQGMQKLHIPAVHTDFIFAVIGEELGFIGAGLVLILFMVFLWRGFEIASAAPDNFGRFLAAGITIMICFQAFLNIGVAIGALPVTGITLPFISYGGSSLIATMWGTGILLNVSRYKKTDRAKKSYLAADDHFKRSA